MHDASIANEGVDARVPEHVPEDIVHASCHEKQIFQTVVDHGQVACDGGCNQSYFIGILGRQKLLGRYIFTAEEDDFQPDDHVAQVVEAVFGVVSKIRIGKETSHFLNDSEFV